MNMGPATQAEVTFTSHRGMGEMVPLLETGIEVDDLVITLDGRFAAGSGYHLEPEAGSTFFGTVHFPMPVERFVEVMWDLYGATFTSFELSQRHPAHARARRPRGPQGPDFDY